MPPEPGSPGATAALVDRLLATLVHAGTLTTDAVTIPGGDTVAVTRPLDTDLLIDQTVDDPEQNLPYWAEIWPSGIALAGDILRQPKRVQGKRLLEFGSGLGITAAVAVAQGAHLTVTDYAEESLALTRVTCLRHAQREPAGAIQLNWRNPEITTLLGSTPFDVVLAADCVYERRDIDPLIAAMSVVLAPGGALWMAEPGRPPAIQFLEELAARGWTDAVTPWEGPWPDPQDANVTVRTHWLQPPRNIQP